MRHTLYIIAVLWVMATTATAQELASPDGNLKLSVSVNGKGEPTYTLTYKGTAVMEQSRLGIATEEADLTGGFRMGEVKNGTFDETWSPVWGEYEKVRNHYNELAVTFVAPSNSPGRGRTPAATSSPSGGVEGAEGTISLLVRFRLYNDGLGFRYELPEQASMNYLTVARELTEFNLTGDHTLFCIPGDYDTSEFAYATTPISKAAPAMEAAKRMNYETRAEGYTVQTPLMIKSVEGLYINIHEAALVGYPGMLLNVDDKEFCLSAHLTPDRLGKCGYIQLPFHTPWRTIMVSDDARDILASQLIYNLNEPCKIEDTSWIKPQKFVGVWWEMFTGDGGTWAYSDYYKAKPGVTDYSTLTPNGHHPANTERVKQYIDFAAEHGIDAVLVEGWNVGWEDWRGYLKDRQFLFDVAYPDFDVAQLRDYARSKGVTMVMHHETASNAADYERQLDTAFRFMKENGYHSVKTGYVGKIIPRSEYHSSQWMVNHYLHVAQRAADYQIMVNSHEAVRPTGLMRTWPNWVAQESARGGEFESMGGNPSEHTCILPFTRLKGGPMDYTPGLFQTKLDYYKGDKPNEQAGTTLARQLALYVTMPSPLQMACDLPENYRRFPDAFRFIEEVAVDWSNSWYLEAEPGDYITVARQAKGKQEWFVGAITDEQARTATIPFSFLPEGQKFVATVYADGKDADWKENPQSYAIRTGIVTSSTVLRQKLATGGGAAISLRPATDKEARQLKKLR